MKTLTTETWIQELTEMTIAQKDILDRNSHLLPVSFLDDGDWLVVDKELPHAYVLTTGGKVQDIGYHYAIYHGMTIPYD